MIRLRWLVLALVLAMTALAMPGLAPPALAVQPKERLADPALEARARAISANLRCLVCQNETIDESDASLAGDIRVLLRERLVAGDTDAQATQAIVDRYGDFVLLKPPLKPVTYVLWFGPVVILLLAAGAALIWLRRRPVAAEIAVPLTEAEQRRLDALLQETD